MANREEKEVRRLCDKTMILLDPKLGEEGSR
jgi:hypothetical protein